MPVYQHASYGGETIAVQNDHMRLEMHKRLTGWGWGEVFDAQGRCVAILEHLGELLLRDQEIPMRLEAQEARRESGAFGERLIFAVKSLIIKEKLHGTSFEQWINYPLEQHCMEGEVTLTLAPDQPLLQLTFRLRSKANQYARYVRGPWIKVGEGSFGAAKDDAILPGVEWLVGDEWSSGTDWFKDPWALRVVPHPNKVAIPLMALSYQGTGIGLAWEPNQSAAGWFNYRRHRPQPVFASPNFVDRRNNHLLGLMVPEADTDEHENQVYAEPPLELHLEQRVEFDAELFLVAGDSLDVVVDWVRRHGLPVPEPRWPLREALERIARAYNTHLWHTGQGFGTAQTPHAIQPTVPRFAERYIHTYPQAPEAQALQSKIAWCEQQPAQPTGRRRGSNLSREVQLARGHELLGYQHAEGSFPFDPDGRHYMKDDFVVAREYLEPMGLAGDTALDMCMLPAAELLRLAEATGEVAFRAAARKALDYCLPLRRPEGGDFWETPLHSPNLLAAGHAAVAYYLGYCALGDERYRQKAIHWIRALLPFTHLWEPAAVKMLYNTKPCLCSSDWYFANWVRDHVQWEVLETFALSQEDGIDWGDVDPAVDWHRYQEGVTVAALRWMLDHTQDNWRPHNLPATLELYRQGLLDDCFADTHNSTTGNYGGMAIMPDVIALNLLGILGRMKRDT
jgi:hypothetical protein